MDKIAFGQGFHITCNNRQERLNLSKNLPEGYQKFNGETGIFYLPQDSYEKIKEISESISNSKPCADMKEWKAHYMQARKAFLAQEEMNALNVVI